ncbi:MAG: hypothetical protein ACLQVF_26240 [Isosphaeraceae bacterium]
MSDDRATGRNILEELGQAIAAWSHGSDDRPLWRWLKRELDSNGTPIRLSLPEWDESLNVFLAARRAQGDWPDRCGEAITRMIQASLRFTRPDGCLATCMGAAPRGSDALRTDGDRTQLDRTDGRMARTRKRWLAEGVHEGLPHASLGWASSKRVLAGLNDDGTAMRDLLVVDHHAGGEFCRFELFGGGRSWLGPAWALCGETGLAHRPWPRTWISTVTADLAEWSHASGEDRVTRSILLLRGLRLALLSVVVERRSPASDPPGYRIARPPGLTVEPVEGCRALLLAQSPRRGTAQVVPIGLPRLAYATDQGRFAADGGDLVLSHASAGRRTWLPLLVSWDVPRHRKQLHWRVLTVSEQSRIVSADRAIAVRVSWGRQENYVIYRSLAPPAPRVFLGHRTENRFLVGRFTDQGIIEPIFESE